MQETTTSERRIQHVSLRNFKGVESASFSPEGKTVYIIGPNGAGKTSIIDALTSNMPDEPLKKGTHKGSVEIDVDGYHIEWKFSAKNQKAKLVIYSIEDGGQEVSSPALLLKKLFGVRDFKIDEFLSMSESKQLEKLMQIAGIDLTQENEEYAYLYEERRIVNRDLKDASAQAKLLVYDSSIGERKNADEIQARVKSAIQANSDILAIKGRQDARLSEIESMKARLADLELSAAAASTYLSNNLPVDTTEIENELRNVHAYNEKVDVNARAKTIQEKESALGNESIDLERRLALVVETRRYKLANSKLNVTGLTFDETSLYLDGLPFKSNQINTARRIIAGLEIQFAMMGEVRIASFDGSLLDNKSQDQVKAWATEKGVELFIEEVSKTSDKLEIVIEEA